MASGKHPDQGEPAPLGQDQPPPEDVAEEMEGELEEPEATGGEEALEEEPAVEREGLA